MNYYEELGLSPTALPGEIRKAHRAVSRLLHPDQQTDNALRQAAELQMRRINAIVDVLLDDRTRRRYDESLRPARPRSPHPPMPPAHGVVSRLFSTADLVGVTLSAVAATLAIVWVINNGEFGGRGLQPAFAATPEQPVSALVDAPLPARGLKRRTGARAPASIADAALDASPGVLTREAEEPLPHRPTPYMPPSLSIPTAAAAVEAREISPSYVGLWLLPSYGRSAQAAHSPKYVQIGIHGGENNTLYGEYSARYDVLDRPVSPTVEFTFRGSTGNNPAVFEWTGGDGSRGQIELKLLGADSLEAAWRVTEAATGLAVAGGPAVVLKRSN